MKLQTPEHCLSLLIGLIKEYRDDEAKLRAIGEEVREFMRAYPMPRFI